MKEETVDKPAITHMESKALDDGVMPGMVSGTAHASRLSVDEQPPGNRALAGERAPSLPSLGAFEQRGVQRCSAAVGPAVEQGALSSTLAMDALGHHVYESAIAQRIASTHPEPLRATWIECLAQYG